MADSPSWGGHLYVAMPSLDGFTGDLPVKSSKAPPGIGQWGCPSNNITQWAATPGGRLQWVPSCVPDYSLDPAQYPFGGAWKATPVQPFPTIMDRLTAAGLPWKIYNGAAKPTAGGWAICPSFASCWYTQEHSSMAGFGQFQADAAAGNLPAFSVITPQAQTTQYSEHNGFSMTAGDNWTGQIAADLMNGPEWSSTVLFITWDDCGCFYDQVPPGVNPDGTPQGPRVPLVIVSPYARPGYTDTTPATFASILAYTEQNFGLAPLGVNDAGAYPLSNAFDYSQAPLAGARMVTRPVPSGDHIVWSQGKEDS
jgi:phospholipase C